MNTPAAIERLRAQARRLTTPLSAAQPEDGHMVWHVWGEARAGELPIQSFFYIDGEYGALEQAQADQEDWHRTYGGFIPIIKIRLPWKAGERATFTYHDRDQTVAAP